MEEADKRSYIY